MTVPSVTAGTKRSIYCGDNFSYYCHNYRIQYAEKDASDGNLYATGIMRVVADA